MRPLSIPPNTYKCLLESGMEIQTKLESHPATKKMGIFWRPCLASLGHTPKNQAKGEKRAALWERGTARHPRMLRWPRARPRMKKGTGKWSRGRAKKGKKGEGEGPCAKSAGNCRVCLMLGTGQTSTWRVLQALHPLCCGKDCSGPAS